MGCIDDRSWAEIWLNSINIWWTVVVTIINKVLMPISMIKSNDGFSIHMFGIRIQMLGYQYPQSTLWIKLCWNWTGWPGMMVLWWTPCFKAGRARRHRRPAAWCPRCSSWTFWTYVVKVCFLLCTDNLLSRPVSYVITVSLIISLVKNVMK